MVRPSILRRKYLADHRSYLMTWLIGNNCASRTLVPTFLDTAHLHLEYREVPVNSAKYGENAV